MCLPEQHYWLIPKSACLLAATAVPTGKHSKYLQPASSSTHQLGVGLQQGAQQGAMLLLLLLYSQLSLHACQLSLLPLLLQCPALCI